MIAKKYRLPIQYLSTRKVEQSERTPVLTIKVFKSDLSHPRFGVVISKRINKAAPKRNQLKRSVFNFVRTIFDKVAIADYLVIINKKDAEKEEVLSVILNLFQDLRLLK